VSRYQKGKTNLDFTEARDSEWQWHQLGRMQVCISLQTDDHASTLPLTFFTGRMPFLAPNQQRQSIDGYKEKTLQIILRHSQVCLQSQPYLRVAAVMQPVAAGTVAAGCVVVCCRW